MKRILLVLGTAVLFINTFVVPTATPIDGGGGGAGCGATLCKP